MLAEDDARRCAALIIYRTWEGEEPVVEPMEAIPEDCPAIAELVMEWLENHVDPRCNQDTKAIYRVIVEIHIVPAFGKERTLSIDRARVAEFHRSMRSMPMMANQAANALTRIWRLPKGRNHAVPS